MGYSLYVPTPIVISNLIPCAGFPQTTVKRAYTVASLSLDFEPLFEDVKLLIGDEQDTYPAAEFQIPRFSLTTNNFLNATYPWSAPSSLVEVRQMKDHMSDLLGLCEGFKAYDGHRKRLYVSHDRFGRCVLVHNKNLHSAFEFNLHNQQIVHVAILPSTTILHVTSEEGAVEVLVVDLKKKRLVKILSFLYFNPDTCGVFQYGEVLWFSFGGVSIRVEVDWEAQPEPIRNQGHIMLGKCNWTIGPSLGVFPVQGAGASLRYVGCLQDRTRVFDLETESMVVYRVSDCKEYLLRGVRNGKFGFWLVTEAVITTLQKMWLEHSKSGRTPDQWVLKLD